MHFLANYISALRGCCALIFLYSLEIDEGLPAHIAKGSGVPQKIVIVTQQSLADRS